MVTVFYASAISLFSVNHLCPFFLLPCASHDEHDEWKNVAIFGQIAHCAVLAILQKRNWKAQEDDDTM